MEKELKSCTGVHLRADLTGHGHQSPFCQKGWDGRALLGQPSIGHPHRFSIEDLFCPVIFLNFFTVLCLHYFSVYYVYLKTYLGLISRCLPDISVNCRRPLNRLSKRFCTSFSLSKASPLLTKDNRQTKKIKIWDWLLILEIPLIMLRCLDKTRLL